MASQLTTDLRGSDYTASLTCGNPDLLNGSGELHVLKRYIYIYIYRIDNTAPSLSVF